MLPQRVAGVLGVLVVLAAGYAFVLVQPQLSDTSSFSFMRLGRIIDAGTQAANAVRPRLAALSLSPDAWARYLQSREHQPQPVHLRAIAVDEDSADFRFAADALFGSPKS